MRRLLILWVGCLLTMLAVSAHESQILVNRKSSPARNASLVKGGMPGVPVIGKQPINLVKIQGLSNDNGVAVWQPERKVKHAAVRGRRAPARVGSTGSTIYGWLTSYTDPEGLYPNVGLNEIDLNGSYTNMFTRNDGISGGGFIRNGNVCLYSLEAWYGYIQGAWYREFDIQTGEKVVEIEISVYDEYYNEDMSNLFVSFAYNPAEDMIYGYSYNASGNGYNFSKASGSDPTHLTAIKEITTDFYGEACRSMTFNAVNGKLIGINIDRKMVEIDMNTGAQTEILSLTDLGTLGEASGLVYSPIDRAYIWNTRDLNQEGYLFKLDPVTKTRTELFHYPANELFAFFVCPDKAVDPIAPKEPVIMSNTFAGTPALTGKVKVQMPQTREDGTALTGSLTLVANLDGNEYSRTTVTPGQELDVEFKDLTEGNHSFMFAVSDGTYTGATARLSLFLGNDDPKAPAELWIDETGLHWTPVTEGENGGYLDLSQMKYDLALDEEMLATDVVGNFYSYTFPSTVKAHVAQIQAVCNGKRSYVTTSPTYISGEAMQLPVYFKPTEDDTAIMTLVDANGDGTSWYYAADNYGNSYFAYRYDWTEPGDDWIIFPAIDFPDASALYNMSLDAWSDDWNKERFEVKIGSKPAISSMTTSIFEPTEVMWSDPVTMDRTFEIPAAGKYYIALHAISDPYANELRINNIHIVKSTASKNGPAAVTALSAAETAPGELSAKVTFTMPDKLISGANIDAATTLTATVSSAVGSSKVSGKPGQEVQVDVATQQGVNKISVQPAIGADKGLLAYVEVYTGVDIPGRVENLKASVSDDNMTVHLSWYAPVVGENGGYVAPTGNTYMLMGMVPSDYGMRWGVIAEIGLDVMEYDYQLEPGTLQGELELGINVMNAADIASRFSRIKVAAGTPYELPMTDNFTDGRSKYNPMMHVVPSEIYDDTNWTVGSPMMIAGQEYDTESGFVLLGVSYSDLPDAKSRLSMPRFSTMGCTNVEFTLEYGGNVAEMEVYGNAVGLESPVLIGKLSEMQHDATAKYNKYKMTLPAELNNRKAVEIIIDAVFSDDDQFALIASYDIRNYVARDFGLSGLSVPVSTEIGAESTFKTVVTNYGYDPQPLCALKWEVVNGEKVLFEKVVPADAEVVLQPGASTEVTALFTADADMLGDVSVVVSVDESDANLANNSVSGNMRIGRGQQPVVTDLTGTVDGGKVTLSWSLPGAEFTTASFEEEEAFVPNPDPIQGFTNIDADGYDVNGFNEWDCPNEFEPAAFTVWSASEINKIIGTEGIYSASDGDKFLIAFCPGINASVQPDADDWLISPEVVGGTEVMVDMRPILYMYGAESIEFMVSTTDDEMESFSVLERIDISGPDDAETTWNTYRFTLPADARYFALHYISNDKFGIQIDNIRYVAAGAAGTITTFDIYRNDFLIEENIEAHGTYVDANAPSTGVHSYHVVPVRENIRGFKSNTAFVDMATDALDNISAADSPLAIRGIAGAIEIIGATTVAAPQGLPVEIYAPSGILLTSATVRADRALISMPRGIYLVRAASSIAKVTVR